MIRDRSYLLLGLMLAAGCGADAALTARGDFAEPGRSSAEGGEAAERPPEGTGQISPGTLTAGIWDDNRNFDSFNEFLSETATAVTAPVPFIDLERTEAQLEFAGPRPARTHLDVALVIDTTGSMGDEIAYLKIEFDSIVSAIQSRFPNARTRWALVPYRDEGDAYVVESYDFTEDIGQMAAQLGELDAAGGGDYPEAPDRGLGAAVQLAWSGDDTAKLIYWVADAPHHAQASGAMRNAIIAAAGNAIHIYPVAASGTDKQAERTMRSAAQLTGGRYIFLTDDSGVGGTHLEPSIPCYFVTALDEAIIRTAEIELSGQYREPTSAELIRTGGDPQDGRCVLSDAQYNAF